MNRLRPCFGTSLPIIGVVRLPPLPDRPGSPGLEALVEFARADVAALRDGGADGALLVNEHDRPHRVRAQPDTISAMNRIGRAVAERNPDFPIGCQILLNDPIASLAVAKTSGLAFIRCDHFVDPMERPEYGVMVIDPDGLMAYRDEIGAGDILVLADIQVTQATMLEPRTLRESARQACLHLADGVVVTGAASGSPPSDADLHEALAGIGDSGLAVPLLLGGGLDADNAARLLTVSDGAFVATSVSRDERIDEVALGRLMGTVSQLRVD